KRQRDVDVKQDSDLDDYLWREVIRRLREKKYDFGKTPRRPRDFNVFSNFKGGKDYFALIYADGNGMGKAFGDCSGLPEYQKLASTIDKAIYEAVCSAIAQHLRVSDYVKAKDTPVFPFDILLMGGDDVLMVVPAAAALDVA